MSDIYFFTDVDLLNVQTAEQAFGVKSETKFHLTSSFTIKDKNACAYAIMSGSALFLEQVNDNNKVNVILKPLISPRIKMPVKYIVYRGLKKTDDIVCAKVNEIDLVDKYFYPCNYNTGNGMLAVDAGSVLGTFEKKSECGLEIIIENSDLGFTIEKALLPNWSLEVPNVDTLQNRWKREQIRHFVDIAAFYGMHGDILGGISYYRSNNLLHTNSTKDVYNKVLAIFRTKDTVYLDIRNEDGYSYGFNHSIDSAIFRMIHDGSSLQCIKNYYTQKWPLFKVDNNYIKTENSGAIGFEDFRVLIFVDFPISSITRESYRVINYVKGILEAKKDDTYPNTINLIQNSFQTNKKQYLIIDKLSNEQYPALFNGVSIPYCQDEYIIKPLSTIIRIDYIREPVSGIEKLFPVNINIPWTINSQKIYWNSSDTEKLFETDSEMRLLQVGMAEEHIQEKVLCTYFAYSKDYIKTSTVRQLNKKMNKNGSVYSDNGFLTYLNHKLGQKIIKEQFDNITIFSNCNGKDCYILGISESDKKDLLKTFGAEQYVYFSVQKISNDNHQYLLSAKSKLINGQEIESLNKITVYSTDECVFVSEEYSSVLDFYTPPSDIVLHFRRDNKLIHYGFDWLRDEYIGENGLCEGIPEQKINKNGIEQIIPPKSKEEQQQKLKDEFEMCIINNQPYYVPWLNIYKNHAQVVTGDIDSPEGQVQLKIEFSNPQIKDKKVLRFVVPEGIQVDLNVTDYPVKKKDEHGNYVDDRLQARVCDLKNRFITVFCTETSSNVRSIDVKDEQDKLVGKLNICSNVKTKNLSFIHIVPVAFECLIEKTNISCDFNASKYNDPLAIIPNGSIESNDNKWLSYFNNNIRDIKYIMHQAFVQCSFIVEEKIIIHNNDPIIEAIEKIEIENPLMGLVKIQIDYNTLKDKICLHKDTSSNDIFIFCMPVHSVSGSQKFDAYTLGNTIFCVAAKPQDMDASLVAHELGHICGLPHAFEDEEKVIPYKFVFTKYRTDNIMDYLNPELTQNLKTNFFWKWQWEQILK